MPKITTLSGLDQLANLEALCLSTSPSWDSKRKCTVVPSLAPLTNLPKLKHLELFGVRPSNSSLAELQRISSLQSVRVSQYPDAEINRFEKETGLSYEYAPQPSFSLSSAYRP